MHFRCTPCDDSYVENKHFSFIFLQSKENLKLTWYPHHNANTNESHTEHSHNLNRLSVWCQRWWLPLYMLFLSASNCTVQSIRSALFNIKKHYSNWKTFFRPFFHFTSLSNAFAFYPWGISPFFSNSAWFWCAFSFIIEELFGFYF